MTASDSPAADWSSGSLARLADLVLLVAGLSLVALAMVGYNL